MGNKVARFVLEGTLSVMGRREIMKILGFTLLEKKNFCLSGGLESQKFSSSVGKELSNKCKMAKLLMSMVLLSQWLYLMILEVFSNSNDSMSCPSAWNKKWKVICKNSIDQTSARFVTVDDSVRDPFNCLKENFYAFWIPLNIWNSCTGLKYGTYLKNSDNFRD